MRIQKKKEGVLEGDLTPMIDMTFQLIAFFMVLINFDQAEQNDRVLLPDSELAKPSKDRIEYPITLHLTQREDGAPETVILAGDELSIEALGPYLDREADVRIAQGLAKNDITIIIRAHKNARTGKVQNLIAKCQERNLEKFALRAKEDVGNF